MQGQNRHTGSKTPRIVTAGEILASATGLTLLMVVMIEAVFLFW